LLVIKEAKTPDVPSRPIQHVESPKTETLLNTTKLCQPRLVKRSEGVTFRPGSGGAGSAGKSYRHELALGVPLKFVQAGIKDVEIALL
jgi:hypothetical protein